MEEKESLIKYHPILHPHLGFKYSEPIKTIKCLKPLNNTIIDEFNVAWKNDKNLEKILYTKIKDNKFKYLGDNDEYFTIRNNKYYLKHRSLYEFIAFTLCIGYNNSYFIKDTTKNTFIGFISYFLDKNNFNSVDGIHIYQFIENKFIKKNIIKLIDYLSKIYKSISWETHIEENLKRDYDIYLAEINKEKYITNKEFFKGNITKYTIKQRK